MGSWTSSAVPQARGSSQGSPTPMTWRDPCSHPQVSRPHPHLTQSALEFYAYINVSTHINVCPPCRNSSFLQLFKKNTSRVLFRALDSFSFFCICFAPFMSGSHNCSAVVVNVLLLRETAMNMHDSQSRNCRLCPALGGNSGAISLLLVIMPLCVIGLCVIGSFINNILTTGQFTTLSLRGWL